MGMFDDVVCLMPLPGPHKPKPKGNFQTKFRDDPRCEIFTIAQDGRLFFEPHGDGKFIYTQYEDGKFAGEIVFYTDEGDMWWEYAAQFLDGRCYEIELLKIEGPAQ